MGNRGTKGETINNDYETEKIIKIKRREVPDFKEPPHEYYVANRLPKISRETTSPNFLVPRVVPIEVLMIIFEYSSLNTIFQSLRFVSVDFFNITMDENFCERYEKRIPLIKKKKDESSEGLINSIDYIRQSFTDKLLIRYFYESLIPVLGIEFLSKYHRYSQKYTESNYSDKSTVRFRVHENELWFFLTIELTSEKTSYHGQGGGVSDVRKNFNIHNFEGIVNKILNDGDNKKLMTVDLTGYKNEKTRSSRSYSYHGDFKGNTPSLNNEYSGLENTDLRKLNIKVLDYRINDSKNIAIQIVFDGKLRPFSNFMYHDRRSKWLFYSNEVRKLLYENDNQGLEITEVIKTFYHPKNKKSEQEEIEHVLPKRISE